MRHQKVANITCYKCDQKGNYRNGCPNSGGTNPVPDQTSMYGLPTTVTQMVTAFYVVPQSSLVTILKELGTAKQTN